jgi:hypothetical protein
MTGVRMSIAQLVMEYIQVLIWPLVVVVALFLFRQPLGSLIENIRRAEFPGGSIDVDPQRTAASHRAIMDTMENVAVDQISQRMSGDREAAKKAFREAISAHFISYDVSPVCGRPIGEIVFPMQYQANMSFANLIDQIWSAFGGRVEPYAYGIRWQLREIESDTPFRHEFHEARIGAGRAERARLRDTRTLHEAGVEPGMLLVAEPIGTLS